jgi:hypothetical protein
MSVSVKRSVDVTRTNKIIRRTMHVTCFLLLLVFSYGAWDSWATLQLKLRGTPATATLSQKLVRWRQRPLSSTLITAATLVYRHDHTLTELEVELPREIGEHLEVGQTFPIFYDKSHPLRVLHPWRSIIVDHFWRGIAGIFISGFVWATITILISNRTISSHRGR